MRYRVSGAQDSVKRTLAGKVQTLVQQGIVDLMCVHILVVFGTGYAIYLIALLIAQFSVYAFLGAFSLVVDTDDIPSLDGTLRNADIRAQDSDSDDTEDNIEIHEIEYFLLLLSSH